ncbi:Ribonuclease P protein subunit p25-like protein [Trichinella pseudospiralis]
MHYMTISVRSHLLPVHYGRNVKVIHLNKKCRVHRPASSAVSFLQLSQKNKVILYGYEEGCSRAICCAEVIKKKYCENSNLMHQTLSQRTKLCFRRLEENLQLLSNSVNVKRDVPTVYILLSNEQLEESDKLEYDFCNAVDEFQTVTKFEKPATSVVELQDKSHRDSNSDCWIQSPEC